MHPLNSTSWNGITLKEFKIYQALVELHLYLSIVHQGIIKITTNVGVPLLFSGLNLYNEISVSVLQRCYLEFLRSNTGSHFTEISETTDGSSRRQRINCRVLLTTSKPSFSAIIPTEGIMTFCTSCSTSWRIWLQPVWNTNRKKQIKQTWIQVIIHPTEV